jgi:hypothetical protein
VTTTMRAVLLAAVALVVKSTLSNSTHHP